MSPEAKAALLKRLQEGRAKTKAMREDAKSKGLPDPKPRKPRAKKAKNGEPVDAKEAIPDPLAKKPAREEVKPIDGAKPEAVNTVSAMPPSPSPSETTKIDVPNLPSKKNPKKMVPDPEAIPEALPRKGISTTGNPEKYNNNDIIRNLETGDSAISVQYPGQKESIKKMLDTDKKQDKPLKPKPQPVVTEKTVDSIPKHVPDFKAVEGRREPFSFAAIRKTLYQ
jgi:hypothetical protein